MPIFDYVCTTCEHKFEFLKMANDEDPACPLCEEEAEKIISGKYLIQYKGTGFYTTDYTNKTSQ